MGLGEPAVLFTLLKEHCPDALLPGPMDLNEDWLVASDWICAFQMMILGRGSSSPLRWDQLLERMEGTLASSDRNLQGGFRALRSDVGGYLLLADQNKYTPLAKGAEQKKRSSKSKGGSSSEPLPLPELGDFAEHPFVPADWEVALWPRRPLRSNVYLGVVAALLLCERPSPLLTCGTLFDGLRPWLRHPDEEADALYGSPLFVRSEPLASHSAQEELELIPGSVWASRCEVGPSVVVQLRVRVRELFALAPELRHLHRLDALTEEFPGLVRRRDVRLLRDLLSFDGGDAALALHPSVHLVLVAPWVNGYGEADVQLAGAALHLRAEGGTELFRRRGSPGPPRGGLLVSTSDTDLLVILALTLDGCSPPSPLPVLLSLYRTNERDTLFDVDGICAAVRAASSYPPDQAVATLAAGVISLGTDFTTKVLFRFTLSLWLSMFLCPPWGSLLAALERELPDNWLVRVEGTGGGDELTLSWREEVWLQLAHVFCAEAGYASGFSLSEDGDALDRALSSKRPSVSSIRACGAHTLWVLGYWLMAPRTRGCRPDEMCPFGHDEEDTISLFGYTPDRGGGDLATAKEIPRLRPLCTAVLRWREGQLSCTAEDLRMHIFRPMPGLGPQGPGVTPRRLAIRKKKEERELEEERLLRMIREERGPAVDEGESSEEEIFHTTVRRASPGTAGRVREEIQLAGSSRRARLQRQGDEEVRRERREQVGRPGHGGQKQKKRR